MRALEFTTELEIFPVKLTIQGETKKFVLRELTGQGRDAYLNALAPRMRIGQDGRPSGIKNFKDMQADLIARSMYEAAWEEDAEGEIVESSVTLDKAVKVQTVQSWPSSVQNKLFEKCQQMSALGEDAEKETEGN